MFAYSVRRVGQMLVVLLIVSIILFSAIRLIPGDPAMNLAGSNATPEQIEAIRRTMGLDKPIWKQYYIWLKRVFHGNFGYSYANDYPINRLLLKRIPASAELALIAIILSAIIALTLGVTAAINSGGFWDLIASSFSALSFAIPQFLLLILLIMLFSRNLGLLPASGRPPFGEKPIQHLLALVLPACTLGIGLGGRLTRYVRSSILEVLNKDYVRTARSKGLQPYKVLAFHVMRNSLIPVVTILAFQIGKLFSKTIIVETVYSWPGVGQLIIQSINWSDYSVLQAAILFVTTVYLFSNLLADLTYGWLDPRIRYQ